MLGIKERLGYSCILTFLLFRRAGHPHYPLPPQPVGMVRWHLLPELPVPELLTEQVTQRLLLPDLLSVRSTHGCCYTTFPDTRGHLCQKKQTAPLLP